MWQTIDSDVTNSTGLLRISRHSGHMRLTQDAGFPTNESGSSVNGTRGGGATISIYWTEFLIRVSGGLPSSFIFFDLCLTNLPDNRHSVLVDVYLVARLVATVMWTNTVKSIYKLSAF